MLAAVVLLAGCGKEKSDAGDGVDLIVFAPHPDDETLGAAGITRQALAAGKRVKIVVFTSGDGFPAFAAKLAKKERESLGATDFAELARYRQTQTLNAFAALGGSAEDVIFLGYPDSALQKVYDAKDGAPVTQNFTQKSATYGAVQADYHSAAHGKSAPYVYASAHGDVVELLRKFRPARICVTSEADSHPDHKAAFRFVRDAARTVNFRGEFLTSVIHGGAQWPWPKGITPESKLESHEVNGVRVPSGVEWPPPRRIALSPEDAARKLAAIRAHSTHLTNATEPALIAEREYLESFVKAEEVFWLGK
jgi:LmbE family N-acetylglucosaminyl deacetylase